MRFLIVLVVVGSAFAQETAAELDALAAQYRTAGRLADADAVLDRLRAMEETVGHVEQSARVKAALGRWADAQVLYERALALRLDTDPKPTVSIPTRHQLVQALLAQKKFAEATQQAYLAARLRTLELGPSHPEVANDTAVLARVYQAERNWRLAAETWETVVRIQSEAHGAEDLRLANSLDDLAVAYKELQSIPQAEAVLRRALAIRELNQGPMHTDVAHSTDELGQLLYGAERYAEAEPFFERSLEIYTAFWGPGNPQLARNLDNLAVTEAMLQKFGESAEHYGAALKIRDGETALNLHHLGLIEAASGHAEAAEPLYRRLLTLLDTPGNEKPELRATAAKEYEALRRELSAKRVKAPVAAKQK